MGYVIKTAGLQSKTFPLKKNNSLQKEKYTCKQISRKRESERDTPGERGTGVSHGALHVGVLQTHHNINVQINVQQRKSKY